MILSYCWCISERKRRVRRVWKGYGRGCLPCGGMELYLVSIVRFFFAVRTSSGTSTTCLRCTPAARSFQYLSRTVQQRSLDFPLMLSYRALCKAEAEVPPGEASAIGHTPKREHPPCVGEARHTCVRCRVCFYMVVI